jgi:hypothetical protein
LAALIFATVVLFFSANPYSVSPFATVCVLLELDFFAVVLVGFFFTVELELDEVLGFEGAGVGLDAASNA